MEKILNYKFYKDFLNQVCVPQLQIYIHNEDKYTLTDMYRMFSAKKSIEENPIVLEEFCKDWREQEKSTIGALEYELLFTLLFSHAAYAKEQKEKSEKTFSENLQKEYVSATLRKK